MLYEAPPYYLVNGVSILPDHSNRLQYYYQPLAPRFVTRRDGDIDVPQMLLLKFASSNRSGGLFDFDVHLGIPEETLQSTRQELQRLANLPELPNLAPVPVVGGTIKLMLLGSESGAPLDGTGLVRSIIAPASPALFAGNRAAFSVELPPEGITILEQAMRGEMSPIGVVYSLDYLALRPAYHVKLTIDWDRTQEVLDQTFGHKSLFTAVQIQDTIEKLQEQKIIKLEADTFVPEDGETGTFASRRDAAVQRVRDMITDAFFESSIDPLREAPSKWDKVAEVVKSLLPQRTSPVGVFSYKNTHYTRIDSKRLDVDFSERITLKRSMYPQGHLAGLFRELGQGQGLSRLVIDVKADDPFFTRRKVRVISRADFDQDPIRSTLATLTYGGEARTALLDKAAPEAMVEWASVVSDGKLLEPVDVRFDVNLLPSEGGERPNQLTSDTTQVLGETAEIEPRNLFSLEPIPVLTVPSFPFDRYPQIDVHLRYDDPAHEIRQDDVIRVTKDQPNAEFRRFLVGPPAAPVMVRMTYRAADNRDHQTPFLPLDRPQVDVVDPFPQRLKVSVVSALNFTNAERAFVDLVYEQPSGKTVEGTVEITEESSTGVFTVDREDPRLKRVRYRITILLKDGTVLEGPWSTTLGQRIFVRADIRGHRSVSLRSPADFAAANLERIEVEARAADELAGLEFGDRFEFTLPDETSVFEFDFVDPAKDSYELRIKRLFRNGLSTSQDWQRFDQDGVTIAATT